MDTQPIQFPPYGQPFVTNYVPGSYQFKKIGSYQVNSAKGTWGKQKTQLTVPVAQKSVNSYVVGNGPSTWFYKTAGVRKPVDIDAAKRTPRSGNVMRVVDQSAGEYFGGLYVGSGGVVQDYVQPRLNVLPESNPASRRAPVGIQTQPIATQTYFGGSTRVMPAETQTETIESIAKNVYMSSDAVTQSDPSPNPTAEAVMTSDGWNQMTPPASPTAVQMDYEMTHAQDMIWTISSEIQPQLEEFDSDVTILQNITMSALMLLYELCSQNDVVRDPVAKRECKKLLKGLKSQTGLALNQLLISGQTLEITLQFDQAINSAISLNSIVEGYSVQESVFLQAITGILSKNGQKTEQSILIILNLAVKTWHSRFASVFKVLDATLSPADPVITPGQVPSIEPLSPPLASTGSLIMRRETQRKGRSTPYDIPNKYQKTGSGTDVKNDRYKVKSKKKSKK